MALRTGFVALTEVVKHLCRILGTWRKAIDAVLDTAVASSIITSAEAATAKSFLDLADGACTIFRKVSGY